MSFVVLANPQGRRLELFQHALVRRGLPAAFVVGWADFLRDSTTLERALDEAAGMGSTAILRIESSGQDFEVERSLIALGAGELDDVGTMGPIRISARGAAGLSFDLGRILYPRQWFLGFRRALEIVAALASSRSCVLMSDPADIAIMFDKPACHARLAKHGVEVSPSLGSPRSFDELRALVMASETHRVFVKLSHGSSASGVVALSLEPGREMAYTSAERQRIDGQTVLYNSRAMSRYRGLSDMAEVLDVLCREGVIVEQWLPKAALEGAPFDLRVVTIAQRARHVVARVGRGPITNLHLGNRRGDLALLKERITAHAGPAAWPRLLDVANAAARVFPRTLHAGVDLLVPPGFTGGTVLEMNAFGDLIPGVLEGAHDTYEAEIEAMQQRLEAA